MLIALSGAALSILTLATDAALPVRNVPPVGVTVLAAPDVPAPMVTLLLAEVDAIWRPTGINFIWQRGVSSIPTMLRVRIDGQQRPRVNGDRPLGWVLFDDDRLPEPEIHLS